MQTQVQKPSKRERKGRVVCVACGTPMKLLLEQPVRKEASWFWGNLAVETPKIKWFKCPRCQRLSLYAGGKRSKG